MRVVKYHGTRYFGMGATAQKTNHLLFSLLACCVQRSNRSSQGTLTPANKGQLIVSQYPKMALHYK